MIRRFAGFVWALTACASMGGLNREQLTESLKISYRDCQSGQVDACNSFVYGVFEDKTLGAEWKREAMQIAETGCKRDGHPQLCVNLAFRYEEQNRRAEAIELVFAACKKSEWDCASAAAYAIDLAAPVSAEQRVWVHGRVQEICAKNSNDHVCKYLVRLAAVASGRDPDEIDCEATGGGCLAVANRHRILGKPVPEEIWNHAVRACTKGGRCDVIVELASDLEREVPEAAWASLWSACIGKRDCYYAVRYWRDGARPKGSALAAVQKTVEPMLARCADLKKMTCASATDYLCEDVRFRCHVTKEWFEQGILFAADPKRSKAAYTAICPRADSMKTDAVCKSMFHRFQGVPRSYPSGPCMVRPGEGVGDVSTQRGNVMQTGIALEERWAAVEKLSLICRQYDPPSACKDVPERFYEDTAKYKREIAARIGDPPCRPYRRYWKKTQFYCPPGHYCFDKVGNRFDGNQKTFHEGPDVEVVEESTCVTPELRKAYSAYLEKIRGLPKDYADNWKGLSFDLCP